MHTVWTAKDGLPSDSINDILQDRDGYIWIGTFNGLVRFDGINFTTFSKYEDHGFESNSVTALLEGAEGNLWIGTNGEGIARYSDNKFIMFNNSDLKDKVIKSFSIDKSGSLWIGTGNGLLKSDNNGVTSIPLNGMFREKSIEMIYHDREGLLWVSTMEGGVKVFFEEKIKKTPVLNKINNIVITSILKDKHKNTWIGTKNQGLFLMKRGVLSSLEDHKFFRAKTITSILSGVHGCIWIGTDSGLFRYYDDKFHQYSEKNGLSNNQVSKILEDKEGNIWIATSRGGLNKLSEGKFTSLTSKQGLTHDKVNSILQVNDNTYWIGTDGGLSVLNNGIFANLKITDYLKGVRIRHINKDSTGKIWISTYSDLGIVSVFKGRIKNYTTEKGLTSNRCRVSIEDSKGEIWVGTSNGLNLIENNSKIKTFTKRDGLSDNYILSIFEDSRENLWIMTNGGGISILKDGIFKILRVEDGLASNIVFRAYEDSDNVIWISTSKGLSRYDRKNFFNFSEKNGLPEIAIFQVLEDSEGRLWMIAESGIYTINKHALNRIVTGKSQFTKITLYNDHDGLLDSPTPVSWAIRSSKGVNWFPTLMGIASIDTFNIPINKKPPPLLIEMIKVDNKNYSPLQIKVLSPNYKRITFAYTALSYVIPHKVQYVYKLEGFDEGWSKLTTKREVSYTTLPSGEYTFRVKAVNNDGIWNTDDTKVKFRQKPFFYKTLWFNVLIILAIIGILALLLGFRIRTLRKRAEELEKQVAERTAELETTDRIVANINKEINFDKLLNVLLQQTMIMFPQAEKGVIFAYNRLNKMLEPKVTIGDSKKDIFRISMSFDEAFDKYVKNGKEYEKGIFIIDEFSKLQHPENLPDIELPESVIAMTIMSGETLEGFFVIGNMSVPDAFTRTDAKKMMRIREHTISAVFKAKSHQKLEEAAIIDPLTRIHNRRKMIEVLENELIRTERTKQPFCVVMCDIDHFKKFNDTHGHDCGDFVLVEISRLIKKSIRKQDYVGRWGGEEFLMVYPETKITGGKTVTEKVRSVIENTVYNYKGIDLNVTATFGVAVHSKGKSIDEVIKEADDVLYQGKQQGRNCVIVKN